MGAQAPPVPTSRRPATSGEVVFHAFFAAVLLAIAFVMLALDVQRMTQEAGTGSPVPIYYNETGEYARLTAPLLLGAGAAVDAPPDNSPLTIVSNDDGIANASIGNTWLVRAVANEDASAARLQYLWRPDADSDWRGVAQFNGAGAIAIGAGAALDAEMPSSPGVVLWGTASTAAATVHVNDYVSRVVGGGNGAIEFVDASSGLVFGTLAVGQSRTDGTLGVLVGTLNTTAAGAADTDPAYAFFTRTGAVNIGNVGGSDAQSLNVGGRVYCANIEELDPSAYL